MLHGDRLFLLRSARTIALLVHQLFEPGDIDSQSALARHEFSQIERKPVRIVKFEGELAANSVTSNCSNKLRLLFRAHVCNRSSIRAPRGGTVCWIKTFSSKSIDPLIQRLVKRFLFASHRILDLLLLRSDFGKDVAHRLRHHIDKLEEERFVKFERAAVPNRASQNSTQNVMATSFDGMIPSAIAKLSVRM